MQSSVAFDKEIFLDRYMVENRDETTKRRQVVSTWKAELLQLQTELRSYTNYKGANYGLDQALQSVIEYCSDKRTDPFYLDIVHKLSQDLKTESDKMKGI
jgi:hypothetical protein